MLNSDDIYVRIGFDGTTANLAMGEDLACNSLKFYPVMLDF